MPLCVPRALLYLQELAEELTSVYQPAPPGEAPEGSREPEPDGPWRKRRRRRSKKRWGEEEPEDDADFVPSAEGESDLLLSEASESEPELLQGPSVQVAAKCKLLCRGQAPNGLHNSIMAPVWKCLAVTHSLRERLYSHWEFPEWIPSTRKWSFLSESEAAQYLPKETKSPLFSIQREGLQEDCVRYRINRFNSLQPHEERLDVTFFVGGPVWAMEWCPVPDGSAASQYVALYCNQGMDDRHSLAGIHTGPALLQLWDLGPLQQETGKAGLAYAIATDHGCIWDLKFCPSGAWELPVTCRKPPHMSRLGLLAVAFSDGKVLLYSLPHPEPLLAHGRAQPPERVQCVATLQVGSIQAGNSSECGQCFSLAWLPAKPHQSLAAGFYDGTVAIWNLPTKSLLQRVRQPDGSLKLYPFRCFLAHDHAVRSIQWCKANRNFLVTAGNDRKIRFWDLRRLHEPINSIKRFLSTEIAWLLPYNGVAVAQDICYASYGLCGIHYLDGTVWSLSGSDWLNSIAAGDITGELMAAVLPDLSVNPLNIKRPSERRFPIYKADLLPCGPDGGMDGQEPSEKLPAKAKSYSETVNEHYIRFQDTDLRNFKNFYSREPMKRMQEQEMKPGLNLDRLQLEAVHKVRFSPNLDCCSWLVSGGQSGIVRAHCLRGLASPPGHKLLLESRAQFSAVHEEGQAGSPNPNAPRHTLLPAK
uniref:General transcription factor 3C polypeptide 2 n=1 Tax=Sphenodon punctatus TaxID=8508 RepID=A0A8D0GHC9_SPHPU